MPNLLDGWIVEVDSTSQGGSVVLLAEVEGARDAAMPGICAAVKDHLIGVDILARLGRARSAAAVERIPVGKRIRSGDLGEIMASLYISWRTQFRLPLKRLRYKDDREMSMRGDDLVAIDTTGARTRVLKGEVKSRAAIGKSVVKEACEALDSYDGRPKPSTLAFMSMMLRINNEDADAEALEDLQTVSIRASDMAHLIFTMSGNNPKTALAAHSSVQTLILDRRLVGLEVRDHASFVATIFEEVKRQLTSGHEHPSEQITELTQDAARL